MKFFWLSLLNLAALRGVAQTIESIDWTAKSKIPPSLVRLVGKDIHSKEFQDTIKVLRSTEDFRDLSYRMDAGKLHIGSPEKALFREMVWNFPPSLPEYVTRDLQTQLDLHEGDVLPNDLDSRMQRLKNRLIAHGLPEWNLQTSLAPVAEGKKLTIGFVPSDEKQETYKRISFAEVEDPSLVIEIANRLDDLPSLANFSWKWEGLDYVAKPCCFLKDDIDLDDFKNSYRKSQRAKGFLNFDINLEPGGTGELKVTTKNLRRFNFQFEGQTFFWENELRNTLLDNLSDRNFEIEEAKGLIQSLYLKKGFRDVTVEPELENRRNFTKILFRIRENRQYFFRGIDFRNVREEYLPLVKQAEKEWIEPFLSPLRFTYFDEAGLKATLGILIDRIKARGFLDVVASDYSFQVNPNSSKVTLKMGLRLGPRYQYSLFELVDPQGLIEGTRDIKIPKPQEYFDGDQLANVLRQVKLAYDEAGYLFSEVQTDPDKIIAKNSLLNTLVAKINIVRGPQVFLRSLNIHGNKKTKEKVITREQGDGAVSVGEKITPKNLREFQNRLLGTGLFSTVDLKPVATDLEVNGEQTLVDYDLSLKERSAGSFEFGPGFRTDLGIVGFGEFSYRNIGGWNRGLFAKSTVSHKLNHYHFLEQNHSVSFVEPYPLEFRSRLGFNLTYSVIDDKQYDNGDQIGGFDTVDTEFTTTLEKKLTTHLSTVITLYNYSLPKITNKLATDTTVTSANYQLGGNGIELLLDYRDDIFNPLTGWFVDEKIEYYSPYLGSGTNINFLTSKLRVNKYFHLGRQTVFAVSLGYDHLVGLARNSVIPENKRLTLGGQGSLRFLPENFLRFDQSGVASQRAILGRFEFRMPLVGDLGMAAFYELGKVDILRDLSSLGRRSTGLRNGAGFGVRYRTPVGPLAVDWAYNLDPRDSESQYQVSLSIGTF